MVRSAPSARLTAVPAVPAVLSGLLTALLTAVLAVLGVLVAAQPAAASAGSAPAVPVPGAAWVRAGHFVPGFGPGRIDLTPGSGASTGIVMSPNAHYGDVTPYQKVAPGLYTVTLRLADQDLSTAPLLERTVTLTAGSSSTLAAVGSLSAPRLTMLPDDLTPPPAGSARVRVLDATSRLATLTVQARGGPTLTTGAVLGQVTGYTTVPQGTWPLALGDGGSAAATRTVTVRAGSVYTAVVLDQASSASSTASGAVTVDLVTDAVGSSSLPVGGARTGEGGLALAPAATRAPVASHAPAAGALLALLTGVALAVAVRRRRPRVPATPPDATAAGPRG